MALKLKGIVRNIFLHHVPIYYTWVERDNCGRNALSKGIMYRVGFEAMTLWLQVESTIHTTTELPQIEQHTYTK